MKNSIKKTRFSKINSVHSEAPSVVQGSEIKFKMGFLNIFVCVTLLIASFLINNSNGKVLQPSSDSQLTSNELQKRPVAWIKAYPMPVRRSKQANVQNRAPSDMEFVDETDDEIRKRYGGFEGLRKSRKIQIIL